MKPRRVKDKYCIIYPGIDYLLLNAGFLARDSRHLLFGHLTYWPLVQSNNLTQTVIKISQYLLKGSVRNQGAQFSASYYFHHIHPGIKYLN